MTTPNFQDIITKAIEAGRAAGEAATPKQYNVVDANGNIIDTLREGLCGFAWVVISPANSKFANFLKKNGYGSYSPYDKGVMMRIGDYGQSYDRKKAHAAAMAQYITNQNLDRVKARVDHRLD